jgi:phage protein D
MVSLSLSSSLSLSGGAYREPACCRVYVDGSEIVDLYPFITEVTVDASRKRASTATLVFEAPVNEAGEWTVQDGGEIVSGAAIKIEAVFGAASEEAFRGYILAVAPSYPQDRGQTRVRVTCRDETLLLDQVHVTKQWGVPVLTTDLAIVSEIASSHGLAPAPANQEGQTGLRVAQNGSDIAFLQRRARDNGYELYTRDGQLYFGPMQLGLDAQPPIMVYAGAKTNCVSIDVNDDAHRADTVSYDIAAETGADVNSETLAPDLELLGTEAATGQGSSAGATNWRMTRTTTPSAEEARSIAQSHANNESMRIITTGEIDGALYGHVLQFGVPVGVSGVGTRYGGRYYVDAVVHKFTPDGYRQTFALSRNAYGDDLDCGGGLLDAVLGV